MSEATITIRMNEEGLHMHFEGEEGSEATKVAQHTLNLLEADMRRQGLAREPRRSSL